MPLNPREQQLLKSRLKSIDREISRLLSMPKHSRYHLPTLQAQRNSINSWLRG